jgi:hypothetical protein
MGSREPPTCQDAREYTIGNTVDYQGFFLFLEINIRELAFSLKGFVG